jgi:hypothetical protein
MPGPVVVVAGAMANKPRNGGEAWVRLSWIRGLQRLGCDVCFVEQIQELHCADDRGKQTTFATSANLRWFRDVMAAFDLSERATLLCDTGEVVGMPAADLADAASGGLLVNISGNLDDRCLRSLFRRSAYIDIDPGFTQIWHANGSRGARLEGHDRYFTVGENIGTADCPIPADGFPWRPLRQPVVLADWPLVAMPAESERSADFTTVATWRGGFGPVEYDRRRFGLKLHEFRKYVEMPGLVPARFEAALGIAPSEVADLSLLRFHGWQLAEPTEVAGTPDAFRSYVAQSAAEFSAAQGLYVDTGSGWFSDRTARYLACGRPVLVQDTGFGGKFPVGKGLVSFTNLAEAVAGAEAILSDLDGHAAAARSIAESYFDSDLVLGAFLEACLP